jgi:hypothetical protein
VDVLEDEDERLFLGERLEELAVGPERLLRAERPLGLGGSSRAFSEATHDLLQRPKGDALAMGEATTLEDNRSRSDLRDHLRGKARLPEARRAKHGHEQRRFLLD